MSALATLGYSTSGGLQAGPYSLASLGYELGEGDVIGPLYLFASGQRVYHRQVIITLDENGDISAHEIDFSGLDLAAFSSTQVILAKYFADALAGRLVIETGNGSVIVKNL